MWCREAPSQAPGVLLSMPKTPGPLGEALVCSGPRVRAAQQAPHFPWARVQFPHPPENSFRIPSIRAGLKQFPLLHPRS